MSRTTLCRVASGVAGLLVLAGSGLAWAQDPSEVPSTTIPDTPGLDIAQKRPYWSGGKSRPFVASTIEAGLLYYRPQIAIGWGKPHWRWFGAEAQTRVSISGGTQYVGVRAALPQAEFRFGGRYVYSVDSYLARQDSYTEDELEYDDEPNARYFAVEAEFNGAFPIGSGALFGTVSGAHILGVPDHLDVYEQIVHVVVEPPWVVRARGGYVHAFGDDKGLKIGLAGEVIHVPERGATIVRTGPQLGVALTHHLDAALSIMAVVASPDSLRLEGTEIGQFGFRYRWATGDPFPEFP